MIRKLILEVYVPHSPHDPVHPIVTKTVKPMAQVCGVSGESSKQYGNSTESAESVESEPQEATEDNEYVVTSLDYRAAFDSNSHTFLDEALTESNCTDDKTRAIFRAMYQSASAVICASLPGDGTTTTSDPLDVNRGVVQGIFFHQCASS